MKKYKLKERLNTGSRIGLGGVNSDGPYNNRYRFKNPTGYHSGGLDNNPDSIASQRISLSSTLEEEEYKEDPHMLEDEETLEEFFARMIKMPLNEQDKEEIIDEDEDYEKEKEVDEMSAGGVGGAAVPFHLGPDGEPRPKGWRKKFNNFSSRTFGGK